MESMGVSGEFNTGESLGTYNGGILQTVNAQTLQGTRSSGGWMEVFTYWTPCVHSHIGYGLDKAKAEDVPDAPVALGRVRNSTFFGTMLWDVNQAFRVGLEITYRDTDYKSAALPDNNGTGVHTQLQWAF